MYAVGLLLLGLGITFLVPCAFMFIMAEGFGMIIGGFLSTALVAVPMIVGGITLIRRAEDRDRAPAENVAADTAVPPIPHAEERSLGGSLGSFDLNRLNWVGWLLLLGTFGFVVAEGAVLAMLADGDWWGQRRPPKILGLPLVLLAVGFFVGAKWLLRALGVSIHRK